MITKKNEERISRLTDLLVDGSITQDIYTKKTNACNANCTELRIKIDNLLTSDDELKSTLETLLELVSNCAEIFESSEIEKKRKILNLVFTNFFVDGSKLCYTIKSPFNLFVKKGFYQLELPPVEMLLTEYRSDILQFSDRVSEIRELLTIC